MAFIYSYENDNTVRDERVNCDNTPMNYTAILMAFKNDNFSFFFCLLKT